MLTKVRMFFISTVPFAGFFGYRYVAHDRSSIVRDETLQKAYKQLPLRLMSRIWGRLADTTIPYYLRSPILSAYSYWFDVDLSEMAVADIRSYRTLCEFFTRTLRPEVRPIAAGRLISPCDGRILQLGRVCSPFLNQIKNVRYSLDDFMGMSGFYHSIQLRHFYYCIIYLAPGDYHRFHSPTDWTIQSRKHFAGHLLSVNPKILSWIENLFSLNERVLYCGYWPEGFFSYGLVAATNVGNVRVYCDRDLETNTTKKSTAPFSEIVLEKQMSKGECFGEFRMGSTVVLVFEAPVDFQFTVKVNDQVRLGQLLASGTTLNHGDSFLNCLFTHIPFLT